MLTVEIEEDASAVDGEALARTLEEGRILVFREPPLGGKRRGAVAL